MVSKAVFVFFQPKHRNSAPHGCVQDLLMRVLQPKISSLRW